MARLKLKGRIIENFGSVNTFAKQYGTTRQTVNNVIRGEYTPKGLALLGWLTALKIPENEAYIFFTEGLENQTEE